jgi:ABC-2 type transport system permease protein
MNLRRVATVAHKEWREIIRDRLFFSLAFIVPIVLMVVFGFGLSLDVENIPLAVVDYDHSAMSRDYAYRFINSRYFDFKGYSSNERGLDLLLSDNSIRATIIIPERFQENLLAARPVQVQTIIDGSFPSRALTTRGYLTNINSAVNVELVAGYLSRIRGIPEDEARQTMRPIRLDVRYLYNQSVKSIWSLAPELIMIILMITPPFLTAVGVVREKESGAIYNIYASTVGRLEFLVGKLTPYVFISIINAAILWLLATGLFDAPFKGDFFLFFGATVLYVTCTTGIGLVVSSLVRTQIAAMIVTSIVTILPAFLYSGVFTPVKSLTKPAQVLAHMLPAMYYTNIALGSFLKGVGFDVLWMDMLILAVYAAALLITGYLLFHKRPST